MELQDFVKEALVQVIGGVTAAQDEIRKAGSSAEISPALKTNWETLERQGKAMSDSGRVVQLLEFDIAVTVAEKTQTKGKIGIAIGVLGLGSQGQSESSDSSASRIKFSVPILLPTH